LEFGIKSGNILVHKNESGSNQYCLQVSSRSNEDFLNKIGFTHPKKQFNLVAQVAKRYRKKRTRSIQEIETLILTYLKSVNHSRTMDIANNIQLGLNHTLFHLKRMRKESKVKSSIEENKFFRWHV
jgi:hypothetical protein